MKGFREGVVKILSGEKGMESIIKQVKDKFNTDDKLRIEITDLKRIG